MLEKFTALDEFYTNFRKVNVLNQFIDFAAKNGVPPNKKEIAISTEIIEVQLNASIIRNILDNKGFYPTIEKIDNTLLKAIEVMDEVIASSN